jgi:hypothetical protein
MRLAPSALLLLAACAGDTGTDATTPSLGPPAITDLKVSCDGEAGAWTFQLRTDAWAGGAYVVWTKDGVYVERHTGFRSVAADPDGRGDLLRDDVAILADFRAYSDGATAFTCRDAPTGAFVVLGLDREPSDCVRAGPAPELLVGVEGVPACERVLGGDDADAGDTDTDTDG